MSEVVICRPVGGITINSEMEFVLDGEGGVRIFDSTENARKALRDAGCTDEEMAHDVSGERRNLCTLQKPAVPQPDPGLQVPVFHL